MGKLYQRNVEAMRGELKKRKVTVVGGREKRPRPTGSPRSGPTLQL
jgi:hypothetical protein